MGVFSEHRLCGFFCDAGAVRAVYAPACENFGFLRDGVLLSMSGLIIVSFIAFIVFLLLRRRRLAKEFEEKIEGFIEICDSFFVDFDEIFNHFIQDAERDAFISKYKALYHELQRYSGIPTKVDDL